MAQHTKTDFPLLKYIVDREEYIKTLENKEKQESASNKWKPSLFGYEYYSNEKQNIN